MAKAKLTTDGPSSPKQKKSKPAAAMSAPAKPQPSPEPVTTPAPVVFTPSSPAAEAWAMVPRHQVPRVLRWAGWITVIVIGLVVATTLAYAGKAYPGVSVDGAKISGLGRDDAINTVKQHLANFQGQLIPVTYGDSTVQIATDQLAITYNVPAAVDAAIAYGHTGSIRHRLYEQLRSLVGRTTNVAFYTFSDDGLTPYIRQIDTDTATQTTEASLNFSGSSVTVNASTPGRHLNIGYLVLQLENRIANASWDAVAAPIAGQQPIVDTASLSDAQSQAASYVAGPINLQLASGALVIPQDRIVSWIKITRPPTKTFAQTLNVSDFYAATQPISLSLDNVAITKYVADLAGKLDQTSQNAVLAWQNNQLIVATPSRTGQALDQAAAARDIKASFDKPAGERSVTLSIKTVQPDVNENNLAALGIKELISEGATTFPGSISDRISNIQVGTSKFVGVLIKPGDTFSFDNYLGDIDAAHGWKPGLAIVGNKIIPEFGGGICQVSSTMYRAALLAGLPITERVNHAYAISWYTAPYGVPGVDATIYAPQVDLKFVNDTGSYILIQPNLDVANSSLKFDFYGTKTKSGAIRGPNFVSGNSDATQPSTTVFYRDVLDLAGNVIKTDTVTTHYSSSLDFTHVTNPGLD